jgi:pyruvate dehydrogenase E2 component (dihydrolipoamide acetyltransferase)
MPRQGNTVESCLLNVWTKAEGDFVESGEVIAEIETDKATFELEAPAGGVLLKKFFAEGEDIPVLTVIGAIGEAGENVDALAPTDKDHAKDLKPGEAKKEMAPQNSAESPEVAAPVATGISSQGNGEIIISPRARTLAVSKGVNLGSVTGTGPGSRIIERDIIAALSDSDPLSPAAVEGVISEGLKASNLGSGIGGRVMRSDLKVDADVESSGFPTVSESVLGKKTDIPLKGVRKLIAHRMRESLRQTAQLTLNASADATAMLKFRKLLKETPEELGLSKITLNDFILYAVSRTLPRFTELNAHFLGDRIAQFENVHIGMAVDTPRGLMVPVIRNADQLSLRKISIESKRLSKACLEGSISPDELSGSTFTISNLGVLGIESFTPVLNPPEVAILGVCNIQIKPVLQNDETAFVPHMGLSLTMDHQATDGAHAARFLKELSGALQLIEYLLTI